VNRTPDLEAVLERIGALGSGPVQALRLLGALGQDETSAAEVRRMLDLDPMLATRVLRVANSAFYGQSRQIGTLERAVVVLGFDTVRAIAAAACLDQTLTKAGVSREDAAQLLRHSLFTAVAAQKIALALDEALGAEAFMAGLIHDIGCTAALVAQREGGLPRASSAASAPVAAAAPAPGPDPAADHADLSRRLLERWQLPARLCACAGGHHGGAAAGADPTTTRLIDLVRTADGLAATAGWSHAADLEAIARPEAPPPLALEPALLESLLREVPVQVAKLAEALGAG
jgi:HD-like signal output (HDOD) protein